MPNADGAWTRAILACAVVTAALGYPCLAAPAEQRVALVIGNSAYPAAPLRNPVNDANAMADKLRALGFDVILRTNVNFRDMTRAVNQFGQKLKAGSVGLFYYAGHGLQVRGKNFLIPVDAEIDSEASVRGESIDVDQVLDQFSPSRLSMVILDACRNNPFERRFRASTGTGLAQIDAPKGTLIAYSTAPGKTAADGSGANGVYTEQLLRAMDAPGIKVEDVFKQVRINVARATQDQQIPWEASSLTGEFFFRVPLEKPVLAAPAAAPAPSVDPAAFEMAFWDSIKTSTNRAEYEAYLEHYPKGRFAGLARSRVAALQQQTLAAANPQPVTPARASPESDKERAELLKALEDERKRRDRDAETVKTEMEKLRAELLKLRDAPVAAEVEQLGFSQEQLQKLRENPVPSAEPKPVGPSAEQKTQIALASPTAGPAATTSAPFTAEWAQRISLLEKSRGQLTLSKAMALLLDITSADELSLLLTFETKIKSNLWNNAYAIGVDNKGNLVWGGSYRARTPEVAAETAIEYCAKAPGDSCKVVFVNGKFVENDFLQLARQLSGQTIVDVRKAYVNTLAKNPVESRDDGGNAAFRNPIGFASARD